MTQQRVSPISVTSVLPAVPVLSLQAALGQSADLTQWRNSSGASIASVNSSGFGTFGNLVVTSSTVPANGVYLPAANTLGFATNSTEYARITSSGSVYFNSSSGGVGQFNLVTTAFSGINMDLRFYSADANGAAILGRKARGTEVSPTATQSGDFITGMVGRGYGATAFGANNVGLLGFYAAENFTDSAQGTEFRLGTTPTGSATRSERMRITNAGLFLINSTSSTLGSGSVASQLGVVAGAATTVGAVIRGAASQTANLQEWQNSAGTVGAAIGPSGNAGFGRTTGSGVTVIISTGATTNVGLMVDAVASQTADIQQWRNSSGLALSSVSSTGTIYAPTFLTTNSYAIIGEQSSGGTVRLTKLTATGTNPGSGQGRIYFRDGTNAGTLKLVVIAGASGAETTILDNIPQT